MGIEVPTNLFKSHSESLFLLKSVLIMGSKFLYGEQMYLPTVISSHWNLCCYVFC